ncbi:MAG: DUF3473 domain-containing protein [bacterium]|nr:DUF3473 domain-containing protein [bacterium]
MLHAFTVDVEDWYQGIPIGETTRASAERRLERGCELLLDLLEAHGVRGTFFVLGPVAQDHPRLVERMAAAGHEIGCHGWSHDLIYSMTPERFREETVRARDVIADRIGKPVVAYRAAYFSITQSSLWALEVLAELGFRYDSSIFPVQNWRYGLPGFEPRPHVIETPSGSIYELPGSVRRVLGRNFPAIGGAYFRIYPYGVSRANLRALERQGIPGVFYLHPWELDVDHPKVGFHWKAWVTHYFNLGATKKRLERLLSDFRFGPLSEVLEGPIEGRVSLLALQNGNLSYQ